jgi:hypothetical protein
MTSSIPTADALAERLFGATLGSLELYSVYLGAELGLYEALAHNGPQTPDELAGCAGIAPRYAREWLEQQAVAGLLDVQDSGPDRRYALSPEHARVLTAPDDAAHVAPFAHMIAGIGQVLPRVVEAYRTGGGVSYHAYGRDFRHGQGHINRPRSPASCRTNGSRRCRTSSPACAAAAPGWPTWGVARDGRRSPSRTPSPQRAWTGWTPTTPRSPRRAGTRPRPEWRSAPRFPRRRRRTDRPARPVRADPDARGAARHGSSRRRHEAACAALADGGTLLVVDERVADSFTAPGDEVERMMFGWSVTHCLPTQMVEQPSAALGTAMRADTVRELAAEAGFSRVEVLPVENEFFRLYRCSRSHHQPSRPATCSPIRVAP